MPIYAKQPEVRDVIHFSAFANVLRLTKVPWIVVPPSSKKAPSYQMLGGAVGVNLRKLGYKCYCITMGITSNWNCAPKCASKLLQFAVRRRKFWGGSLSSETLKTSSKMF